MSEKTAEIEREALRDRARELVQSFDREARRSLRRAAGSARLRELAHRTEHAVLTARLGADAPETRAAARRAEAAVRRAVDAVGELRTAEAGSRIADDEAAVLGQVRAADGRPVPRATVTLTDERGGGKQYLARSETGPAGSFALTASVDSFRRFFEGSKQLVLEVEGGVFDVDHAVIGPYEEEGPRIRHLDVTLPKEALATPGRRPREETVEEQEGAPEKVYLAEGARGALVRRIQEQLAEEGVDPGGIDGIYGPKTRRAVAAFQEERNLSESGEVDGATWRELFDEDPPGVLERSLQVTASFEGHDFTHAAGNWDGAGVTWGIIGFTLRYGSLGEVVRRVHERHPELLVEDFGPQRSRTLLDNLAKPVEERLSWADSISLKDQPATLHKPWREAFASFGARPEVQAAQRAVAGEDYGRPARKTAEALGLESELGFALCFDAQVQNGGIKRAARERIEAARAEEEPADERASRRIVARAVAEQAQRRFREDVLARKMTLADGEGTVHGRHYVLRAWGLDETPA